MNNEREVARAVDDGGCNCNESETTNTANASLTVVAGQSLREAANAAVKLWITHTDRVRLRKGLRRIGFP